MIFFKQKAKIVITEKLKGHRISESFCFNARQDLNQQSDFSPLWMEALNSISPAQPITKSCKMSKIP